MAYYLPQINIPRIRYQLEFFLELKDEKCSKNGVYDAWTDAEHGALPLIRKGRLYWQNVGARGPYWVLWYRFGWPPIRLPDEIFLSKRSVTISVSAVGIELNGTLGKRTRGFMDQAAYFSLLSRSSHSMFGTCSSVSCWDINQCQVPDGKKIEYVIWTKLGVCTKWAPLIAPSEIRRALVQF